MRRMNNLVTFFTAMCGFFFGSFLTTMLMSFDRCPSQKSGVAKLDPHPDIFLVVLVLSAPQYMEKRQAMRETWLRLAQPLMQTYYPEDFVYLPAYNRRCFLQLESVAEQTNRLRVYSDWLDTAKASGTRRNIKLQHFFAIGSMGLEPTLRAELEREHKSFKDILLLPRIQDSYANLTEKLLHAIDALTSHYDFSYLLKVDDDSYVKLDSLLNELVSYDRKLTRKTDEYKGEPLPELHWGYFNGRANIKTKGQWAEANYYLSHHYITYALGGGYVVSRKICEYITNSSHHLATYVSEDVSLGTWLSPLRQVYRRHDPRFDTGYMPRKCRRYHLVYHKCNPRLMRDLYAGKSCPFDVANEKQLRRPPEYYYDWTKPADKCCDSPVHI